jgi:hypothetical protein
VRRRRRSETSKALLAAIRKTFGRRALIQRCQVHKRWNVEDHPPESVKKQVGRTMTTAYRCGSFELAIHVAPESVDFQRPVLRPRRA